MTVAILTLTTILSGILLTGLGFFVLPNWHVRSVWQFGLVALAALAIGLAITVKIMSAFQDHKQHGKLFKIIAELIEAIIFAW